MLTIFREYAFFSDVHARIDQAKKRIYVQFMTFDGDKTGRTIARKLISAKKRGVDVQVIIDCFTDCFVNDKPALLRYRKAKETREMIQQLRDSGISVVRTRPLGAFHVFVMIRNHKKIVVVDDTAYLGGINISDHNKAWHDFMVRITNPAIVQVIAKDFRATFSGVNTSLHEQGVVTGKYIEIAFDDLIASAKQEIILSSPYFAGIGSYSKLKKVHVPMKIYTARTNNYPILRITSPYIYSKLQKQGAKIFCYTSFSHAKCLIVDGHTVFFGSSNFGTESFCCKDEIGLIFKDRNLAKEFKQIVFNEQVQEVCVRPASLLSGFMAYIMHLSLVTYSLLRPLVPNIRRREKI